MEETLKYIKGYLFQFLGHQHWDSTGRHGAGCEKCVEQYKLYRELMDRIDAALMSTKVNVPS